MDTNWHQLVVVYDQTNLSISVDGTRRGTLLTSLNTAFSPVIIGAGADPGTHFSGAIDDVRIYNRVLTQAEIQTDMNTPVTP